MSKGATRVNDADVAAHIATKPLPLSMDFPVPFNQEKALGLISDQEIEQLSEASVVPKETNSEVTDIGDYVTSDAEKAV
ncbi:hypothetical protein K7432_014121, partial [Basidiobolus ranarum]